MSQPPDIQQPFDPLTAEVDRYAALLDEAKAIKGASLWKDARQRLRKNRMAMLALYYLIGISVLAAIVPVLPLQSPLDKDLRDRKNLPPNLQAVRWGNERIWPSERIRSRPSWQSSRIPLRRRSKRSQQCQQNDKPPYASH